MTRGKTKVAAGVLALLLALALAAPAYALGDMDLGADASIGLSVADAAFRDDLEGYTVDVLVYKVADVNEHGAFTPTAGFEALAENVAWNDGILNLYTDLEALIDVANGIIFPEDAEPAEDVDTSDPLYERLPAIEPLFTAQIDPVEDTVPVQDAETAYGLGLYLLLPRKMQTVEWVYTFNPLLVGVPSIERDAQLEGGIPTEGEWLYDVPAQIKATRVHRLTDITIAKTLQEYNADLGATTFLFDVQASVAPEGHVFSRLVPLTFAGTGTQSVTVSGIPVGAQVTVTEVYSGASYYAVNGRVDIDWLPLPDEANGMNRVPFTNTYTNRQNPDASIVNTWVRQGEGWTWQSGEEAGQ